jgi:hypothetical protein
MRILDADPGDQKHADPCGCGSATLVLGTLPFLNGKDPEPDQIEKQDTDPYQSEKQDPDQKGLDPQHCCKDRKKS